ncbi:MAG: TOBE domain-containing protein [Candidatus Margulisiibacteriota bacterium]
MNKLEGKIVNIESSPEMSIVQVDVSGDVFTSIVLETPETAPYLKLGAGITVLFKETEVSLATNLSGNISLRNRFKSPVKKIEKHALLATVTLDYKGKDIVSIITSKSVDRLGLKEGESAEWLIKTNEVSLWHTT